MPLSDLLWLILTQKCWQHRSRWKGNWTQKYGLKIERHVHCGHFPWILLFPLYLCCQGPLTWSGHINVSQNYRNRLTIKARSISTLLDLVYKHGTHPSNDWVRGLWRSTIKCWCWNSLKFVAHIVYLNTKVLCGTVVTAFKNISNNILGKPISAGREMNGPEISTSLLPR